MYNKSYQEFQASVSAKTQNIFTAFNQARSLQLNENEFFFYSRKVIPIDDTLVSSYAKLNTLNIWHLVKKSDYDKLNQFLHTIMPSIVVEAAGLNDTGIKIVHCINSMHTDMLTASSEEVSSVVLSLVPFDKFSSDDDEMVKELVRWFKEEFFSFVKTVPCHLCNSATSRLAGYSPPSESEAKCLAPLAELYQCNECGAITRFPRYNDVLQLIKTRKGRCGEISITFAAFLKALDYDVRFVTDLNDHLWVEYWSEKKSRYVPVDPCENIVDCPYTYEVGWGKQMLYVIAVSDCQCADVTPRYTREVNQCHQKRISACPDEWYFKYLHFKNQEYLLDCDQEKKNEILEKQQKDFASFQVMRQDLYPEERRKRISGNE